MTGAIRRLGASSSSLVEGLGRVGNFGAALLTCISKPPSRFGFFLRALYDAGVLSIALICLSGFTVGMVLGLQLYTTLSRFGAEESLGLEPSDREFAAPDLYTRAAEFADAADPVLQTAALW